MKLTTVILLATCLHVAAAGHSQRVTISLKNVPIPKVFQEIVLQSDVSIIYNDALFRDVETISIDVKDALPLDIVKQCLSKLPFKFIEKGNSIIVSPSNTTGGLNPRLPSDGFSHRLSSSLIAPPITGKVTGPDGQPIAGANVVVKGTKRGTVTGADGSFSIEASNGETIVISSIGFNAREVKVEGNAIGNLSLVRSDDKLDEVQIIAYGAVNKKFSTSNQGTITAEQIAKQPVSNPLLALQGRVPGLFIQQTTGQSVGRVGVLIQGLNTLTSGADPFYVVDGVPYSPDFTTSTLAGDNIAQGTLGSTGPSGGSTFNFINPTDIESITILKDADATAIYGSRAANGAILITTKRGKSGKTKMDLNTQSGWGKVTKKPTFLNTTQYLEMRKEAYKNSDEPIPTSSSIPDPSNYDLTIWDQNKNHDWWNELVGGTANFTTAQGSVSGGTDRTTFLASTGYSRQTTVYANDLSDTKYNVGMTINTSSENQKFKFMIKSTFLQDLNRLNGVDLTAAVSDLAPNAPDLYKSDGSLNWGPFPDNPNFYSFENPLKETFNEYHSITNNLIGNSIISYDILPGLVVKSSFGYNMLSGKEKTLNKLEAINPQYTNVTASSKFLDRSINSYIIEPQISYYRQFDLSFVDILIGGSFQQTKTAYSGIEATGFNNDNQLSNPRAATTVTPLQGGDNLYRYSAAFARINYRYNDRYIINVTARRDGSSRFGINNQIHNFYSLGGAWLFSEERLFKNIFPFANLGKLRLNYGTTGNDQIGDYAYESRLENINYQMPFQGITALIPNGISNQYLQWESTRKMNAGLDLSFLNNKFSITANFYRNRSSNQLVDYILPGNTGFLTVKKNFEATVQNTGLELLLNATPITRRGFAWSLSANATVNRNKLIDFPNLENSPYANFYVIGQPVNIIKVYKFGGVDPTTGFYQFITAKGELVNNPDPTTDNIQLVNINPKWYGGFTNSISFKGFDFEVLLQYVNQVSPNIKYEVPTVGQIGLNPPDYILRRWQNEGDITDVQKYTSAFNRYTTRARTSDARYSDGSFLRLKNVSLSYNIPAGVLRSTGINNFRVFLLGQNLATITKYEGADPETHSLRILPPLKMFTLGLHASL